MNRRWLIAFGLIAACGAPTSDSCPSDEPSTCPTTTPSYAHDVLPVMQSKCFGCHADPNDSSGVPLDTYAAVDARSATVLSQIANCAMPQSSAPQLTTQERATVMGWLVCGAPNN